MGKEKTTYVGWRVGLGLLGDLEARTALRYPPAGSSPSVDSETSTLRWQPWLGGVAELTADEVAGAGQAMEQVTGDNLLSMLLIPWPSSSAWSV